MATFDYSKALLVAKGLIVKFGSSGSFILSGNTGGYDDSGNVIAATDDNVIEGTITPLLQYKTSEIDGQNILMGDSYVFFDSDTPPEIGYHTTINGDILRAVDVTSLTSVDGVRVYTKIQLRK